MNQTYSLAVVTAIDKNKFDILKCHCIPDGLYSQIVDKYDGRVYEVTIRPTEVVRKDREDVDFCGVCGKPLSDEEQRECRSEKIQPIHDECYQKAVKEHIEETRHPDNHGA